MNTPYTYTFDTSALLNGAKITKGHTFISTQVLKELEQIKVSSSKDENIKYQARTLTRFLSNHMTDWITPNINKTALNWLLFKDKKLVPNSSDSIIIAESVLWARKNKIPVLFETSDLCQALLAKQFPELCVYFYQETNLKENLWKGYRTLNLSDNVLSHLYENLTKNKFELATNEYAIIETNGEVCDLLKWTGSCYDNLKYKDVKSDYFGTVQPRNIQQKMMFDLLQNRNIPVKLIRGQFGSGKSYVSLVHAMNYIRNHKFDKMIYVRNNIEVYGSQKLGALPGEEQDKLLPYMMPIADHLGSIDMLFNYMEQSIIEPVHLGYMRGRSFTKSILFVDEAENLTTDNVKLLLGRVGDGSELWLLGDESQTDSDLFKKNNGIASLLHSLKGESLFGTVELEKSERGAVAQLSARVR